MGLSSYAGLLKDRNGLHTGRGFGIFRASATYGHVPSLQNDLQIIWKDKCTQVEGPPRKSKEQLPGLESEAYGAMTSSQGSQITTSAVGTTRPTETEDHPGPHLQLSEHSILEEEAVPLRTMSAVVCP